MDVLSVEAGGEDTNPLIAVPMGYARHGRQPVAYPAIRVTRDRLRHVSMGAIAGSAGHGASKDVGSLSRQVGQVDGRGPAPSAGP